MKQIVMFFLALAMFSCNPNTENRELVIFDRIRYIYNLKAIIDKDVWQTFNDKKFDVPLIYYTDTSSYVANPSAKFVSLVKSELVFQNESLEIYRTDSRVDSLPFHMETSVNLLDNPDDYTSVHPYMQCSGFEQTSATIRDVTATEQWSTMIIHEYFHGFQYMHPAYLNFFRDELIYTVPGDSLRNVYKKNDWFKEYVDRENDLLLKAIGSSDSANIIDNIDRFFKLRNKRRAMTKRKLKLDIEKYEATYETMEGTARYVEYSLYDKFSTTKPDLKLLQSDTSFHSYDYFKDYHMEKDQWLYLTSKTSYFYATGFNIARLLDKLNVEYKSRIFEEGGLSLEQLLKTMQAEMTASIPRAGQRVSRK